MNKRLREQDNIYGGVRYRFSYDDCCKEIARKSRRGLRTFALTAASVTLFCTAAFASVVLYRSFGRSRPVASMGEDIQPIPIVSSDKSERYDLGGFVVRNLAEHTTQVYHVPQGVIVAYANPLSASEFKAGDIIVSVGDTETPSIAAFAAVSAGIPENSQKDFLIFREGEYIELKYVFD